MANLEFIRVSADGTQIIVRDEQGQELALSMDDRLAAALIPRSSPAAGPGALSPREIQARIRAGADVASLAHQTGTPEERIMAFAVPILQERAHIAARARATLVRQGSAMAALEDVITARLQPLGIALLETHWDARRLDDGRWEVRLAYDTVEGGRVATWTFDAKAAVIAPADDEAHWLMGTPASPTPRVQESATRPTLPVFKTVEEAPDNVVPMKRRDAGNEAEASETDEAESRHPSRSNSPRGRRPVPSWDEILFGAPTDEE